MSDTRIRDIMIKNVATITESASLHEAVCMMVEKNIGSLIVIKDEDANKECLYKKDVMGMLPVFFTLSELIKDTQGKDQKVTSKMFSDTIFIRDEASIEHALKLVTNNKTWRLLVYDRHDMIVGIVSSADIMKHLHNSTESKFELVIGEDTNYYGIDMRWENDNDLVMNRGDEFVIRINNVKEVTYLEEYSEKTEQSMMLLKVFYDEDKVTALYLDADPVQTNAREVDSSVNTIKETLEWLLRPGYFCRQGDIGFYVCDSIPADAVEVPREEYEDYYVKPFHKRHYIEPKENCNFYVIGTDPSNYKYYMKANKPANIVHPEHPLVELPLGCIEVVCAGGEPLPKIIGLKEGETMMR